MSLTATLLRVGLSRGLIELRQSFSGTELIGQLFWPVATLTAIHLLRDSSYGASGFTLGTLALPGTLGMFIALGALLVIQYLTADREDGTLLRAKATPNGISGYFIGKLVTASGSTLAYLAILLIPGLFIVDGLDVASVGSWLTLTWVLLLGLVATQSIGAMLGALISTPRGAGFVSIPVLGLVAISGVFYPITALPEWLQWTAQAFPFYWLSLGMRSALLPDSAASVELGESWRHVETICVLGAWAALGLIAAPMVLRRMARRESGSAVAERRDKALQRIG
ncbi:ABC transporter permease [Streptomyces albipurpureus]|uniref:Transport permease protein n=1 Tax=Streptomyces albipurpureus TaxID=2897419 RepID=A0ABT0UJM7_9ACTN|nr:ABC transporter permease [Streptomyces sp. CWNU-1]MCM2388209.1 ABC transporter permease [Streptomyces sp. CWNU-1]